MPIPLVVWAVGIGASAIAGAVKTIKAGGRVKQVKVRYAGRRARYEAFHAKYEARHELAATEMKGLATLRLRAMVTVGEAVRFLERAKLKDRDLHERVDITPGELVAWQKAAVNAVELLGGALTAASSGALAATAAYGLVGTLASASTGTAIATLSGAAATNATLAWLGGGTLAAGGGGVAAGTLVLGGLAAGPAILVVGWVADWQAAKQEATFEGHIAAMDRDEAQKRDIMSALDVMSLRIQ